MATPRGRDWELALHDFAGHTIRDYVRANYDHTKHTLVDIGAGWAKYKLLLPEFTMDGVEIWEPYYAENKLRDHYREMFMEDIRDWAKKKFWYDAAIMGDTLEHLAPDDAKEVVRLLLDGRVGQLIVAVPYQMEQDEWEGNKYEKHLQPDLGDEVMAERYPQLERIAVQNIKAIFVSKRLSSAG